MWMTEWKAMSARIAAIFDSAKFIDMSSTYWDGNRTAAGTVVFENAQSTAESLGRFLRANGPHLSDQPRACLERFLATWVAADGPPTKPVHFGLLPALTLLASFRAEFEYLIADTETHCCPAIR